VENKMYQNKIDKYKNEGLRYGDTEKKWYKLVDLKGAILWKGRCGNINKNQLLIENCNDNKINIKLNIDKRWYEKEGEYLGTGKCSCLCPKRAVYKLVTVSQA
jgi:hypothetical protein